MTAHATSVKENQAAQGGTIHLASVTAMAFADAVVKLQSGNLTIWQVFVARSIFALPCLLLLLGATKARMRPATPGWVVLRSSLLILAWLSIFASLPLLALAVVAVAMYTNPIVATLLGAILLGERVASRQWLGVFVGFCGVVVILKPGSDTFSWAIVLPLLSAVFYSCAMILTRSKCRGESAIGLAAALHTAFIATGAAGVGILALVAPTEASRAAYPFLLNSWTPMSIHDWQVTAFLGVLAAAYFLGVARAYQIAPPHVAAVFDNAQLVSAARSGPATVIGMVLIATVGLLVASPRPAPLRCSGALRPAST